LHISKFMKPPIFTSYDIANQLCWFAEYNKGGFLRSLQWQSNSCQSTFKDARPFVKGASLPARHLRWLVGVFFTKFESSKNVQWCKRWIMI
jgi:hypothetical protein